MPYANPDDPRHREFRRDQKLRKRYGITAEQYDQMSEEQGHVCKLCGNAPTNGRRLHVDHCHQSGEVRGLLCTNCNHGLGKFFDNVELLQKSN